MTNEELMNMMTDMGLHEGGMENWVMDNAWVEVAKRVAAHEREKLVQVSPLEFVTAVLGKEHLVGKPFMWAQWPNEEKK